MHTLSSLCLCLVFFHADAQFGYGQFQCQGMSSDDALLTEKIYYNKMLYLQYNSSGGKIIGYTKTGRAIADILNRDVFLKDQKKHLQHCKRWITRAYSTSTKKVEPKVRLRLTKAPADSEHPATLVCSVYNFYPKDILVTWLKNGEKVTSEVTSTESLPSGNWLYQRHSYLEYTPTHWDKISCMVEHPSLEKARIYDWEAMPEFVRNKIILGTLGLIVGVVSSSAGLIYYRSNVPGRVRASTSGDRRDVQSGEREEAETQIYHQE
ncbi:rano class II histocompatibility antigen, A beta chain-like isoform X1 [Hippocampus comes]|uniref:rano class II histocompatibility antigen, A beta chain-like isoform X1 n=1 Tax=Hippocampus comes TaxID=109280 RepID=UPI00094F100E|nr:PREDICTED: rano class II histocompatibility antigen, A beta chain-like isoform X1 [Hippocampus comes]